MIRLRICIDGKALSRFPSHRADDECSIQFTHLSDDGNFPGDVSSREPRRFDMTKGEQVRKHRKAGAAEEQLAVDIED
jgi:hypothetical protein